MNKELVRSLHVYRFVGGNGKQVEREFLFKKRGSYVEMVATPLFKVKEFRVSEYFQRKVVGFWLCIFVFVADSPPALNHIPPPLLVSGNAKLKSIPTLANNMKMIFQLSFQADEIRSSSHFRRNRPEFVQDLHCLRNSVDMCEYHAKEEFEQCASGNMLRERRAASEDVAKISLNHQIP